MVGKVMSLFFNGGPSLSLLQGSQRKLSPSHTHTGANSDIKLHLSPGRGPAACGEGRRGQQYWGPGPIHHCHPASLVALCWRQHGAERRRPPTPPPSLQDRGKDLGSGTDWGEPVKSYGPEVCVPRSVPWGRASSPPHIQAPIRATATRGLLLKALHDTCTRV